MFTKGQMVCLMEGNDAVLQAIIKDVKDDKILVNWIPDGDDEPGPDVSWELSANFRAVK